MITTRGHVEQVDIDAFREAGFGHHLVLEFITIVAASVITNYTANGANPPLEPALQPHAERIAERGGQRNVSMRLGQPRGEFSESRRCRGERLSRPKQLEIDRYASPEHRPGQAPGQAC